MKIRAISTYFNWTNQERGQQITSNRLSKPCVVSMLVEIEFHTVSYFEALVRTRGYCHFYVVKQHCEVGLFLVHVHKMGFGKTAILCTVETAKDHC